MSFRPAVNSEIILPGMVYTFSQHPDAKMPIPYGQTGKRATVYQVRNTRGHFFGLKVFFPKYRVPQIQHGATKLREFSRLPGLQVCTRVVFTKSGFPDLIKEFPDLEYTVLMPWVDGKTWFDIVFTRQPLTPQQSIHYARSLSAMFVAMEEKKLAHCDISNANVFLETSQAGNVALVDVEEMYAPDFEKPVPLPAGSDGYGHKTASSGIWSADADRFSGAVLLAEILAWPNLELQALFADTHYFEKSDMQVDCPRYQALMQALPPEIGELFRRAWFSETLAECPTFTEWNQVVQQITALPIPMPAPVLFTLPDVNILARQHIAQAQTKENVGDFPGAIAEYQQAQAATNSDSLHTEIHLMILYALMGQADTLVAKRNFEQAWPLLKKAEKMALNYPGALKRVQDRLTSLKNIPSKPKEQQKSPSLWLGLAFLGVLAIILGFGIYQILKQTPANLTPFPTSVATSFGVSPDVSPDVAPAVSTLPNATLIPTPTLSPTPPPATISHPTATPFTATLPEYNWQLSSVDLLGPGPYFDLKAGAEKLYLAYYQKSGSNLRVAVYSNGNWEQDPIKNLGSANSDSAGHYVSLGISSNGTPRLLHYVKDSSKIQDAFLTSDGSWSTYYLRELFTIYSMRIAFNSEGNPDYAVLDRKTNQLKYMRALDDYATFQTVATVDIIPQFLQNNYYPFAFQLDSTDTPWFCYTANSGLTCATLGPNGKWLLFPVNENGALPSLIIDKDDNLRLSYYDLANEVLMSANFNPNTQSWQHKIVDNSRGAGLYPCLELNEAGLAVISYYDNSTNQYKLAQEDVTGDFQTSAIANAPQGSYSSLTIDSRENPWVAYYAPVTADGPILIIHGIPK